MSFSENTLMEIKQSLLLFACDELQKPSASHIYKYVKSKVESNQQVDVCMMSALVAATTEHHSEPNIVKTLVVSPTDILQQAEIPGADYQHFLTATDEDFQEIFRLSRSTIHRLTGILQHRLDLDGPETKDVPIKKKVLLTFWLLGNQEPFSTAATMFNLETSQVYKIFHDMCYHLTILAGKYIRWPSIDECSRISKTFSDVHNIPGVIGVIGYCQVNIRTPEEVDEKKRFWNAEAQRHTILLQLVVDDTMLIRDVCAGFSGSTSMLNAFLRSPLFPRLTSSSSPLTRFDEHLLGSSVYPQLPNLLTPFTFETNQRALTEQEQKFNEVHRAACSVVDRTCASLKRRFRRLNFLDVCQPELASKVVIATCVLHNFAILNGDEP